MAKITDKKYHKNLENKTEVIAIELYLC